MRKGISVIVGIIFLLTTIVFLYLAFNEAKYSIDTKEKNKAIREVVVTEDENNPLNRKIDFHKLKNENKDIVAWIYIPGTTVDYPILIGDTNEEYLYKDLEGNYNPLGSIFSDAKKDLSEDHIKIYGHNMREFQMFGEIRKFLNKEYMEQHEKFYIYKENKTMECDIFSIFICDIYDSFFSNNPGSDLVEVLENKNVNSNYYTKNKDLSSGKVFSLVTCNGVEGTVERLVVNGIVTKQKIMF